MIETYVWLPGSMGSSNFFLLLLFKLMIVACYFCCKYLDYKTISGIVLLESVSSAEAASWSGGGGQQRRRRRRGRQRSRTPAAAAAAQPPANAQSKYESVPDFYVIKKKINKTTKRFTDPRIISKLIFCKYNVINCSFYCF